MRVLACLRTWFYRDFHNAGRLSDVHLRLQSNIINERWVCETDCYWINCDVVLGFGYSKLIPMNFLSTNIPKIIVKGDFWLYNSEVVYLWAVTVFLIWGIVGYEGVTF